MSVVVKEARASGAVADSGMARAAVIGAAILVAVALQTTVVPELTLLGVMPQLSLIIVVSVALVDGEAVGVTAGFFAGVLQDLLVPGSVLGLTGLIYSIVGYGAGYLRQPPTRSAWAPVVTVAVASTAAEAGYAVMAIMLGQTWVGFGFTAKVLALVVLYNTLLTPFVFPVVRRVADRFRAQRVHR